MIWQGLSWREYTKSQLAPMVIPWLMSPQPIPHFSPHRCTPLATPPKPYIHQRSGVNPPGRPLHLGLHQHHHQPSHLSGLGQPPLGAIPWNGSTFPAIRLLVGRPTITPPTQVILYQLPLPTPLISLVLMTHSRSHYKYGITHRRTEWRPCVSSISIFVSCKCENPCQMEMRGPSSVIKLLTSGNSTLFTSGKPPQEYLFFCENHYSHSIYPDHGERPHPTTYDVGYPTSNPFPLPRPPAKHTK